MFPLSMLLKRMVREGTLHVIDAGGNKHTFRGTAKPEVTMRFSDPALPWKIFVRPELAVGEAYMEGTLTIEGGGTPYDLLYLATKNMEWRHGNPLHPSKQNPLRRVRSWLAQRNPIPQAQKNVAHHYDLKQELYRLFLDSDLQYSCAYFKTPQDTLEQAQRNKKALIAKKLRLKKGHEVLDVGAGWGGLALDLHRKSGARVVGITLSREQVKLARTRAEKAKARGVEFRLQDYREVRERFDRVVSVGMFEHVGRRNYRAFFERVRECLKEDGVALLHTIGRADGPGVTDPWTAKYIFPGGYTPALSEILPHIERAGLYVTDLEVWRLHYAETLRHWRRRAHRNRKKIEKLYDARFFRMWDFYLSSAECAFRNLGHVVFQIQLAKRQDAVPLTRGYLLK